MRRRPRRLVTGLPVVLVATTASFTGCRDQETAPADTQDTREAIVMPEPARQTVLLEMRQMLEALNGVLSATVEMDRDRMAEAALSGGTRIAVDTDPEVAERLPEEFIRLGSSTHQDFDALAEVIRDGASRDTVLARMSRLTANCVSCHASYRVMTANQGN